MTNTKNNLYHVHRNENMDDLWYVGAKIDIDNNFNNVFYTKLLQDEEVLIKRWKNYDIDYIITIMEKMKYNNLLEDNIHDEFDRLLNSYYCLRREKALEEGRKIFAPTAPSRLHSIFLTDESDLHYWEKLVGANSFKTFLLELEGNLFISSDKYFPNPKLMFDIQVEHSKEYWKPKIKKIALHKEFVFQGKGTVIK